MKRRRIDPYTKARRTKKWRINTERHLGHTHEDRFDELVVERLNIHLEMMDSNSCWVNLAGYTFMVFRKKGKVHVALNDHVDELPKKWRRS